MRRASSDRPSETSTFWYALIGGGAALIAGLIALLFRRRWSADPAAPSERTQPRENPLLERVRQAEGIEVEPIQAFTAPDFDLRDDSPTAENPTLAAEPAAGGGFDEDGALAADLASGADHHAHQDVDINLDAIYDDSGDSGGDRSLADADGNPDAVDHSSGQSTEQDDDVDIDLDSGSGFDAGEHTQADQDFAFAATTALDFELPEESETGPQPKTDIIPPLNIEESSILKSEVLPEDEDDDYDMSVILDATKQPDPREVTEKDLHAVVVDAGDNTLSSGDYTIARDTDFEILEQDYEDELSATQALNMEIERAARELANGIDEEPDEQLTEELPTNFGLPEEDAPTAIASLDEDAPTAVAPLDGDEELLTDVALLDDETIDAALAGSDDEGPTTIAPLEEDEGPPTAILDDETIDAALTVDDEAATAVAPLDEDEEPVTRIASLDDTSIESQLAHLPGESSAEAANDDALLDDDSDPTGITAALASEVTEDDKTVEISRDDEDETISLSRDGDDDTVEMPPRSKNA